VTLRDDLLRAAGRVRRRRPETARRVGRYLRAAAVPAGGFPNRAGQADLYYTVFGLQALAAVEPKAFAPARDERLPFEPAASSRVQPARAKPTAQPREHAGTSDGQVDVIRQTRAYLATFGTGDDLDFVHLCCLARCRALVETGARHLSQNDHRCLAPLGPAPFSRAAAARLATFRAADGGFSHVPGAARGTAYGAFLAVGAHEDLGVPLPGADALLQALAGLRSRDGGYANAPGADAGSVPAASAALVTLTDLGAAPDPSAIDWLLGQRRPEDGWPAAAGAPAADLLSTATALHALAAAGAALDAVRQPCLTFVETLAVDDAGPPGQMRFRGHPDDQAADCEYTFYGLLAMGHLLG